MKKIKTLTKKEIALRLEKFGYNEIQLDIDLILFGGEILYPDQLDAIGAVFPGARVHSILYASVDGGELGYFDADSCENGEHRCFDESTIMEIVDEDTHEVITEEGIAGKLLVTNLNRRLMPLVRYPVGDRAMWTEPPGTGDRKFKLLGRSEEGARIGPATLYVQDVVSIFEHFHNEVTLLNFQIVISHYDQKDQALIKAVAREIPADASDLSSRILEHLYTQRAMLGEMRAEKLIHPVQLQWCRPDELESNPRTGKTRHILDLRLDG